MIRCKIAKESGNECTDCCFFCDKRSTCEDVCDDMEEFCEEQEEENELSIIESAVPDVLKAITDITVQMNKLEEQQKLMKQKLMGAMEEFGVKKFENDKVSFTYVAPTTRKTLDKEKLEADHPEINLSDYDKESKVSASVRIKVK